MPISMPTFQTDMKTLLTAVKTRLKAQATLSTIKTWKRGVLPPQPVFPALAVLPLRESFHRVMSNGTYWVDRTIRLDLWQKSLKGSDDAMKTAMNLMGSVKDAVRIEYQWTHNGVLQCADTLFGEETYGAPEEFRQSVFQRATLSLICRSQETFPSDAKAITSALTEVGDRAFIDHIQTTLKTFSATTLSKNKTFMAHTSSPFPSVRLPAIVTWMDTEHLSHTWTGVDAADRGVGITVWTKLLDKETALDSNLDLVEALKDIQQTNHAWGGRCKNSEITEILYGQYTSNEVMLYETTLNLRCQGIDVL